jgi:hypothetical protein
MLTPGFHAEGISGNIFQPKNMWSSSPFSIAPDRRALSRTSLQELITAGIGKMDLEEITSALRFVPLSHRRYCLGLPGFVFIMAALSVGPFEVGKKSLNFFLRYRH